MPTFTFVQSTPGPVSPNNPFSQAFPGDTTPGNCIVAVLFAILGGATGSPGFSTDITDSQGNRYFAIQGASPFGGVQLYAAVDIAGGPCTVSASTGLGVVAFEYHSSVKPYYICPGSAIDFITPQDISNDNTGFHSAVGPPSFTSPSECMVVWGADYSGTQGPYTAATGVVRYQGLCPGDFGGFQTAAGDDDVANVAVAYANAILANGTAFGYRACIFLNTTNAGCVNGIVGGNALQVSCNNPPPGKTGVFYTHTFLAMLGTPPYTFSISAGSLPVGLALNSATGVVSGTPTVAGTSTFTVHVTDAAAGSASVVCSITITSSVVVIGATGGSGGGGGGGNQGSGNQGGGGCAPCVPSHYLGLRGIGGLGTLAQTLTQQIKEQYIPPDLSKEFYDVDDTLIFNYVLNASQTLVGLQQPISHMGDFYLCGIQATAHNFPTFGSKGTSIALGLRITDSRGYRLIDDYAGIGFFTPSEGNSFPYALNPTHKFAKGTYIGIDLQEQSASISTVQIAFRGRYRFHLADVMRIVQMRRAGR